MTFENGLTISVQFGTGNYCERRSVNAPYNGDLQTPIVKSDNAEIAIMDKNVWFNFGTDTVKGWVSPDEVATWIARTQKATSINDIV